MKTQQLILEALNLPTNAITYYVSQELAALYPKKALLEETCGTTNLNLPCACLKQQ